MRLVLPLLALLGAAVAGPVIPRGVVLNNCAVPLAAQRQVFIISQNTLQLAVPTADGATLCVTGNASTLTATPCVSGQQAQGFAFSDGVVTSALPGSPLIAVPAPVGGPYFYGQPASLLSVPSTNNTAIFALNTTGLPAGSGILVHTASGLCLDAGPIPNAHACLDPALRYTALFCDATQPLEARVANLLGQLTLAEKIALTGSGNWSDTCDTNDAGVPRLSIPPHQWLVETNSMIASACYGTTCATSFPSGMNLAASFNSTVWRSKGEVMSTEMRAFNNLAWHRADTQTNTHIGLSGFGPDINQPRDPRNGRAGELAGEDPLLIGDYAAAMVQGMQQGSDPRYLKMSAGVKHYAGYSMETNRSSAGGAFSLYDLWDTYLRPYETAFVEGGASGSMCSYVSLGINGGPRVPACANSYILQTVVRDFWGRPDAMHTSDCGAVSNMANKDGNHYAPNYLVAVADALNGGMDLNSELTMPQYLNASLHAGYTTEAKLDEALTRTLSVRFRVGIFDPLETQPYVNEYGPEDIGTPEHLAAAMEGATQGLVLLKNNGALPLKTGVSVAVVGPLALAHEALMGDYYADEVCPGAVPPSRGDYNCVPTVAASISAANIGGQVLSYMGVNISSNDSSWGSALSAVTSSDVIILALGTDQSIAREGYDLTDIALPVIQQQFAAAVFAAAGSKPVILLLISSWPMSFDTVAAPPAATVLAYTPSFGAPAIAAALFGVNRWGRAVSTHYPAVYQNAVALDDFSMVPGPNNPGRGYRYYNGSVGAPLVTFGQGLTYSNVSLKCVSVEDFPSDVITVNCSLASLAGPSGDQVLTVYHRVSQGVIDGIGGAHPVPLTTLVAYTRVALPVGGVAQPGFSLIVGRAFSLVDASGSSVVYPGLHYVDVWDGGVNKVTLSVEVPGPLRVTKAVPVPA